MTRTRRTRLALALAATLGLITATLGFASPASAETITTTTLEIGPSETTEVGQPVVLTASVTPTDAVGTVRFYEGDRLISGHVQLVDGKAEISFANLPTGTISNFNARFSSNDPETWSNSASGEVSHTVVPGDLPVMECRGANQTVRGILAILPQLLASDGVVVLETPIESHVLDTQPTGPAYPVSFTWTITIPDYLVDIAAEFGAESFLSVKDIDVAIEATGSATGSWAFPTNYPDEGYIPDATAPLVMTASGSIAAESEGDIDFQMRPTGSMTVFVPQVGTVPVAIDVILDCEFVNTPTATTQVAGSEEVPVFSDVPADHPFYAEINWMSLTGLSTGYDNGTYQPGLTLTRQAMSAFIYRVNGSPEGPEPTCESAPFNDVPADHPFCGEIAWMKATGISEGYEGNLYKPDDGLTRQAMSAFLYRSANPGETPPACTSPPFPDVPTSNPFCAEIAWMAETGISVGFDDGARYEPNLALTRQAMSAFLFRYTLVVDTEL